MYSEITSKVLTFPKGIYLEHQNIKEHYLLYLIEGTITVSISHPNGKNIPFRNIHKNELFGFSNMNCPNENLSFLTEETVKVSIIPQEDFFKEIRKNQKYMEGFIEFMGHRVNMLIDKMILFSITNNRHRIAYYFVNELKQSKNEVVKIDLSKSALMNYLGMSRGSFYREYNSIIAIGGIKPLKNNTYYCNRDILMNIMESS
ncbi:MAG: Crp/Fnr family transcriptional regulator [Firmicutes bacterium]|jgi:CRP-like cAMP-binding protein|nr:Crp/Fnr family transcriptional regulator [Bacillota bacterium]